MVSRPFREPLRHEREVLSFGHDGIGSAGASHGRVPMTRESDGGGGERPVQSPRGERGDAGGLDAAVEGLVPGGEALIVGPIPGLVGIEYGDNEAGLVFFAADAAG